ncbi:hypothetical protein VTJ49DRAFT_3675 [Mycothermus thermophilus]|uniref:Uncharacterized protein n=1 Tax=Humicola insolens TaxID=85995 RepID=A0ABR3V711_HUMIN
MASEGGETKTYSTDPALYIFTSLTAGSSHIVTATSRLETILRANRIPFKATDIAVDEKARMLWGRRAGKDPSGRQRKLPGLVQMGIVLGDIVEIEEWNEYGELKDHVTIYYDEFTQPSIHEAASKPPVGVRKPSYTPAPTTTTTTTPSTAPASAPAAPPAPKPAVTADQLTAEKATLASPAPSAAAPAAPAALPIRSIAEEAAAKAKQVHLQSLREKVYGKGAAKPAETSQAGSTPSTTTTTTSTSENKTSTEPTTTTSSSTPSAEAAAEAASLQSPTSSSWKAPANQDIATAMQSPRSTSWKSPTDVDPPVTELHGAAVASASPEVIAAVERAETIKEEPEEEEEEEESSDDDEEKEGESEEGKAKESKERGTGAGEKASAVKN